VADDPTADVTIRNEATLEERTVAAGAVPFFTNPQSGWVVLEDVAEQPAPVQAQQQPAPAGKTQQPATPKEI
jgi:hypothetical protein